jgi:F-type H+-transporting ATPase subunit b
MLIDWFTVGAQVLNFIILVWLLKRFLYQPILTAIDAREKRIAAALADAARQQAEAQQERDRFQKKNEVFDRERAALFRAATDEAKAARERLLEETRTAAEALRLRFQEELQSESDNLKNAFRHHAQQEVFSIARKVLSDLASASLDERVADIFMDKLQAMEPEVTAQVVAAIKTATKPLLIRSAFALPDAQREAVRQALGKAFSVQAEVEFEVDPELVSGIELVTDGHKVGWNIGQYLASLEGRVDELLIAKRPTGPASNASPPEAMRQ